MAQNSILLDKSLLFAARIVKLNKYLTKEKKETVISKQIIRSATENLKLQMQCRFICVYS